MIVFLDTSILVAAFLTDHDHYVSSRAILQRCTPDTAFCAGHTLVELYSTLTRLPAPLRISPSQALQCSLHVEARLGIVSLASEEYRTVIQEAANAGIAGGSTYDFLIARCALKAGVERLYTWNLKHYQRFGDELSIKLRTPETA